MPSLLRRRQAEQEAADRYERRKAYWSEALTRHPMLCFYEYDRERWHVLSLVESFDGREVPENLM